MGALMLKAIVQPQSSVLVNPRNVTDFIEPLDVFIVQASTNTLISHFAGILGSLWLFRIINRQS